MMGLCSCPQRRKWCVPYYLLFLSLVTAPFICMRRRGSRVLRVARSENSTPTARQSRGCRAVSCSLRNHGRAARGPTDIKWDLFVLIANGERASDSLTDDQSSKPCQLEDQESSKNVTEVYFHSFSVSVHPGFSGVGTTLCLGGPLERFRVLASGCVCGCAHSKHSFSK